MASRLVRQIWLTAEQHARGMNSDHVNWRHVLLALLSSNNGSQVFSRLGISVGTLETDIRFSLLSHKLGFGPIAIAADSSPPKALEIDWTRTPPISELLRSPSGQIIIRIANHLLDLREVQVILNEAKLAAERKMQVRRSEDENAEAVEPGLTIRGYNEILERCIGIIGYYDNQSETVQNLRKKQASVDSAREAINIAQKLLRTEMQDLTAGFAEEVGKSVLQQQGVSAYDNASVQEAYKTGARNLTDEQDSAPLTDDLVKIVLDAKNPLIEVLLYRSGLVVPEGTTPPVFQFPAHNVANVFLGAWDTARDLRAKNLTVDYLLPVLIGDSLVTQALIKTGFKPEVARGAMAKIIEDKAAADNVGSTYRHSVVPDDLFQTTLKRAAALSFKDRPVIAADIFALLIDDPKTGLAKRLQEWGVADPKDFVREAETVLREIGQDPEQRSALHAIFGIPMKSSEALANYTTDMVLKARQGKFDAVIGREGEINQIEDALLHRKKSSAVLVGDAGVGKSAVVEGLATRIANAKADPRLANLRLLHLDIGKLVAGTHYRGDFEARVQAIVAGASADKNIVLFIDEMHGMVGAGGTNEGTLDLSNILKPYLARGEIRVIGATTWNEYRKHIEKDTALNRRFHVIDVQEPNLEKTIEILTGLAPTYAAHHKVKIPPSVIRAIAETAERYINSRKQPDKSIDVLDATLLAARKRGGTYASLHDVKEVVAKMTNIPLVNIQSRDKSGYGALTEKLGLRIIAQRNAAVAVGDAIKRGMAGIQESGKPLGCFIFIGPTGVGKTLTANVIAEELGLERPIRIDMSEYGEKHSVSRLIGAPPGYVGYDEPGQLTEPVRRRPFSVVLLDEIEKAHPDILSILLQVTEDGRLTDGRANTIDFRNTVLIMTSNIGAREAMAAAQQFGFVGAKDRDNVELAKEKMREAYDQAVRKWASPEFLNRVDQVTFDPLSPTDMPPIVDLHASLLAKRVRAQNVSLEVTPDAKAWLAQNGYELSMAPGL
ncbi:MAG: ATP-dependent Clp protease ATP-binding subunit [Alphaproteobacteria bacterium]|nr:MAG: ATP-dependent Clp protease ATP-binding subunit [Alphaproteobacteria bacterium]